MSINFEWEAIGKILDALSGLNEEQQISVLNWILSRLHSKQNKSGKLENVSNDQQYFGSSSNVIDFTQFHSIADLFGSIVLRTEAERVLMAATYIQIKEDKQELISREITIALKDMDISLSNISSTIKSLMKRSPPWIIQTKKAGNTQQAQKKFRVTPEGIKEAKRLLSGTGDTIEE